MTHCNSRSPVASRPWAWLRFFAGCGLAFALAPQVAFAQATATWTAASGSWSSAGNWTGTAPTAGSTLRYIFEGPSNAVSFNDLANVTVTSATFNSAGLTLSGSGLTLTSATFSTTSSGTQTIDVGLNVGGLLYVAKSSTDGRFQFNGSIVGSGSLQIHNGNTGGSNFFQVTLAGSNNFSGPVFFGNNSTLNLASPNALGPTTEVRPAGNGARLGNTFGSALSFTNGLRLASAMTFVGPDDLTLSGTAFVAGGTPLTVLQGALSLGPLDADTGARGLQLIGPGTLRLTGSASRTFLSTTGTFQLWSGTLALAHPQALGTAAGRILIGTVTTLNPLNSGMVAETDLSGANSLSQFVTIAGGGGTVFSGSYPVTFSGTVQHDSARTLTNNLTGGPLRFDGPLRLTGTTTDRTLRLAGSGHTILAGPVTNGTSSGIGSIVVSGGTLTIAGTATYSGTTTVSGGMLVLSSAAAVTGTAAQPYTLNANATLGTGFAVDQTFLNKVVTTSTGVLALGTSSPHNLDFSSVTGANLPAIRLGAVGPGTQVFSGTLTPSGTTYLLGGGGGTLEITRPLSSSFQVLVGGTTGLGGTVILSDTTSPFTGQTTIQRGTLALASISNTGTTIQLGSGTNVATLRYAGAGGHSTNRIVNLAGSSGGGGVIDASGSGPVSFLGGVTGNAGTTLTLAGTNTGGNFIQSITGSNVVKTGVGTWVFGTNSFSGRLSIEQGTIVAAINAPGGSGTSSALGKENGPIPLLGLANATGTAALLAADGVTISRIIEVAALGGGDQEVVLGGSGAGTATFDGNSAFRLGRGVTLAADPGGNVRFLTPTANWDQQNGSADPAVAVTIGTPAATGTVTLETTLPNSITAVTVRQGTLRLGNGTTVGALGPASVLTGSAGATLAFNRSNTVTSGVDFAATIGGAMNVRQEGSGTVILAGVNTYTGATDVAAGTLRVDGVLGDTAVTVAAGATLTGTGTIGGPTTILGTHAPGASPGIETFTNGLTYGATSTLVWDLIANTDSPGSRGVLFDGVNLTGGALSIVNGATLSLVFNLPGSTVDWSDAFWGTNRSWTIIDVAGGSWNSSLFTTLNVGVDSGSASLASQRPDSSFQIVASGGDLVLEYVIVPEPGALALVASGLAAAAYCRRRRLEARSAS